MLASTFSRFPKRSCDCPSRLHLLEKEEEEEEKDRGKYQCSRRRKRGTGCPRAKGRRGARFGTDVPIEKSGWSVRWTISVYIVIQARGNRRKRAYWCIRSSLEAKAPRARAGAPARSFVWRLIPVSRLDKPKRVILQRLRSRISTRFSS